MEDLIKQECAVDVKAGLPSPSVHGSSVFELGRAAFGSGTLCYVHLSGLLAVSENQEVLQSSVGAFHGGLLARPHALSRSWRSEVVVALTSTALTTFQRAKSPDFPQGFLSTPQVVWACQQYVNCYHLQSLPKISEEATS